MRTINVIGFCLMLPFIACTPEKNREIDPALSQALIEVYKEAASQDNIDALMDLVYWEGVEDDVRQMMINTSEAVIAHEFRSAEVVPMPEGFETTYVRNDNKYGFKIEPFAKLIVQFDPGEQFSHLKKKEYFVIERNGKYMLTTVALLEKNIE